MTTDLSRHLASILLAIGLLVFNSNVHADSTGQPSTPQAGSLYVGGTGASIGILKILTKAYEQRYPAVKTTVYPSLGSGGGINALEADKLTVSFSSRKLKESELAQGLQAHEFLRTPLVFATHPEVEANSITFAQVADMLSGKVTNWPDGTLIRPVLRPMKDTDTVTLMNINDGLHQATLIAHDRTGKNVAATDSDAADEIEKIEGAFGLTTLLMVQAENRRINVVDLDGVAPTLGNLTSGLYPIEKSIYAITKPDSSALAISFVEYLNTEEAKQLIAQNGGLPGKP